MGTRKQINLRISGSRVLGRLKKSCKCCGNPDIHAIHLLPTAYPSKKLANSREKKKKENKSNQFEKFFFPLPLFFVINFLLLYFFSFFKSSHQTRKEKKHLKRKKKSITNQEDGTSFPPHKILKHLKDLKILSDPKYLKHLLGLSCLLI